MKPQPEYIEGPEAWDRFQSAMREIIKVPKASVPNPFGRRPKRKKPVAPKG